MLSVRPRGIRLIPDPENPLLVRSLQYIEVPEPTKFQPLPTAQGIAGLVGLRFADRAEPLDPERERALHALLDQAAIALERAELMEERARSVYSAKRMRDGIEAVVAEVLPTRR